MSNVPCVVLTGGPGGGKTTLMRELRASDPQARRWLLVPEAAPLLFQTGLNGRKKLFQRAVVQLQITLEQICAEAASQGQILVCHRGTLDALAYWLRNGWEEQEFFPMIGMTREEHLRRYTGVIHLQTTAIGAASHYSRWPDAHRPETRAEAAEIDHLCVSAWESHPRYVWVENAGRDWPAKAQVVCDVLANWLELACE
jgi:predicted ATPase